MAAQGIGSAQPNFDCVAECHHVLSTELQRCQNLPAIAGAQKMLVALAQIRTQVNRLEQNMNRMEHNLVAAMSANNHNSVARTQNSLLLCRDDALSPLHNPATNAAIPNFPATPRDIDQLNTQGANAVLESLGQGSDGTLPAKKQRIRITVGLTAARKEGA